jgi:hypothetical protein
MYEKWVLRVSLESVGKEVVERQGKTATCDVV